MWNSFDFSYSAISRAKYKFLQKNINLTHKYWIKFCSPFAGLISRFLSMKIFDPFAKISFNVYIIHSVVLQVTFGSEKMLTYYHTSVVSIFSYSALTLRNYWNIFLSILVSVFFEQLDDNNYDCRISISVIRITPDQFRKLCTEES